MAAPKKTDKKAPKTVAKSTAAKADYRALSVADLQKALAEKQQDLLDGTRSLRANELVNPRVLGVTRKEIARIKTALRHAELESKS